MSPQKTMWAPFIVFRPMDKFELINLINEKMYSMLLLLKGFDFFENGIFFSRKIFFWKIMMTIMKSKCFWIFNYVFPCWFQWLSSCFLRTCLRRRHWFLIEWLHLGTLVILFGDLRIPLLIFDMPRTYFKMHYRLKE
jgi:hypothetical protein